MMSVKFCVVLSGVFGLIVMVLELLLLLELVTLLILLILLILLELLILLILLVLLVLLVLVLLLIGGAGMTSSRVILSKQAARKTTYGFIVETESKQICVALVLATKLYDALLKFKLLRVV